ncbi:MAG: hypothetical protein JSS21_02200 [Proteobacteria bacterium]|nr:hypothetical protein [Pseudomonadota bacterium]
MSAFEFVFALVTIVTSLAITHMLTGLVSVLRNTESEQLSIVHGLWAWSAMLLAIGNWASFWGMRSVTSWPSWTVLLCVIVMVALYAFCALVTPEFPNEARIGSADFHRREQPRYTIAAATFFCLAILANTVLGGAGFYASWVHDNVVSIGGLVLAIFGFFARRRWSRVLTAALLALLTTYYAIVTCNFMVG